MKHNNQNIHDYRVSPIANDFSYISVLTAARIERAAYIRELSIQFSKWIALSLIAPIAAMRRRQRAFKELTALDDHTLADIGISRGDIPYLLKKGANEDSVDNVNGAKVA